MIDAMMGFAAKLHCRRRDDIERQDIINTLRRARLRATFTPGKTASREREKRHYASAPPAHRRTIEWQKVTPFAAPPSIGVTPDVTDMRVK